MRAFFLLLLGLHNVYGKRVGENGPWNQVPQINTKSNGTTYQVTGLTPFTVYSFRLRAVNKLGISPPSKESYYIVSLREGKITNPNHTNNNNKKQQPIHIPKLQTIFLFRFYYYFVVQIVHYTQNTHVPIYIVSHVSIRRRTTYTPAITKIKLSSVRRKQGGGRWARTRVSLPLNHCYCYHCTDTDTY